MAHLAKKFTFNCVAIVALASLCCLAHSNYHQREHYLSRRSNINQENPQVVMGKFRAPAPERIFTQRIPKASQSGSQVLSASYRVLDNADSLPQKVVHGINGASVQQASSSSNRNAGNQRVVSAKFQVSDEGLNYPPSKLSADIYGNVAEIVTAPPEAVENDFLEPEASKLYGN